MYQWARRHPLTMASLQNLGKIPSFSIAIPFKARPTRSRPWPSPTSAMCRSRTCYSSAPPGRLPLVQVMGKKTKDHGFLRKNESYGWLTFKEIDGFIMFISYIYIFFFLWIWLTCSLKHVPLFDIHHRWMAVDVDRWNWQLHRGQKLRLQCGSPSRHGTRDHRFQQGELRSEPWDLSRFHGAKHGDIKYEWENLGMGELYHENMVHNFLCSGNLRLLYGRHWKNTTLFK